MHQYLSWGHNYAVNSPNTERRVFNSYTSVFIDVGLTRCFMGLLEVVRCPDLVKMKDSTRQNSIPGTVRPVQGAVCLFFYSIALHCAAPTRMSHFCHITFNVDVFAAELYKQNDFKNKYMHSDRF